MSAARKPFGGPFAPAAHRRVLIGKAHLAAKELGLEGDDYRAVLLRAVGKQSCAMMTEPELEALLAEFRRLGWKPKPAKSPKPADHEPAAKARALWISLYHLGAIDDASEFTLEAFARRQLGVAKLQWADQGQMFRLIEAEKAIAQRHGWPQSAQGVPARMRTIVLKRRLVTAILVKLKDGGLVDPRWDEVEAARRLCGLEGPSFLRLSESELDMMAKMLGAKHREAGL